MFVHIIPIFSSKKKNNVQPTWALLAFEIRRNNKKAPCKKVFHQFVFWKSAYLKKKNVKLFIITKKLKIQFNLNSSLWKLFLKLFAAALLLGLWQSYSMKIITASSSWRWRPKVVPFLPCFPWLGSLGQLPGQSNIPSMNWSIF